MPREVPCGDAALVLPAPRQARGRLGMRGLEQPLLSAMGKYRLTQTANLELKQHGGSVQGCSLHLKLHPDLQMKTFCQGHKPTEETCPPFFKGTIIW